MAIYTQSSRERLRDAIDFVELVSAHTDLRRAGPSRYEGLCPFHEERTASFGIDPHKKVYHCFGCGAAGDVFSFVQAAEGVDFKEAIERLADRYNVELEREQEDPRALAKRRQREHLFSLLERACAFYEHHLWDSAEAASAREYLARRGLEAESLRAYRVGFAPPGWDRLSAAARTQGFSDRDLLSAGLAQRSRERNAVYDRFRGRITFPLIDLRGRVLGFGARTLGTDSGPKYLNSADNEIYHKGRNLYGANLARSAAAKSGEVIVCEGYTDVIALHQAGIEAVVGLMGTALTEQQMGELARLAGRVLFALDADSAGQEAMLRAARVALARKIELAVVALPTAGTGQAQPADASMAAGQSLDPAELVAEQGPEAMRELIAAAIPFMRFRVQRILLAGDLASAEGRDAVIEQLRPVFSAMPQSAQRVELLAMVSDRLGLPEGLAERLLTASRREPGGRSAQSAPRGQGAPPGAARSGSLRRARNGQRAFAGESQRSGMRSEQTSHPAGRRQQAASPARATAQQDPTRGSGHSALSRPEQVEQAFLALCIASPAEGRQALEALDPSEHFTSVQLRLAAEHLRAGAIADPLAALPEGRRDLESLLAALAAQGSAMLQSQEGQWQAGGSGRDLIAAQLEVQRLQLELARLERMIQAARAQGRSQQAQPAAPGDEPRRPSTISISELAAQRVKIKRDFDRAQERALETLHGSTARG